MGRYTSINAPVGTKVEITNWDIDDRDCYKVRIILWVSGYQVTYEGPLTVTLMDMDWNIIEKRFRKRALKNK